MTFVWPQALLAPGADPARAPGLPRDRPARAPQGRGVRRVGAFGSVTPRSGRRRRPDARRPAAAGHRPVAASRRPVRRLARSPGGRLHGHGHRAGAAAGPDRRAPQRGHGHPRLRHLREHGRHRPPADPDGGRQVAAATDFVQRQPPSVVIGVVAFSDSGIAVQQPTNDPAAVLAAIGRLTPQRGTSLGRGIEASLTAIEAAAAGPDVDYYSNRSPEPTPVADAGPAPARTCPAVIVLLTDGENNERPDPIGVGPGRRRPRACGSTRSASAARAAPRSTSTGSRSTPSSTPRPSRRIADLTGGTYYAAEDAATLDSRLPATSTRALVVRPEDIELTAVLAGAGLALLLAGAVAVARLAGPSAMTLPVAGPAAPARRRAAARRRLRLEPAAPAADRRPLLEPVAHPRGAARLRSAATAPAVRAVRASALAALRLGHRPPDRDRERARPTRRRSSWSIDVSRQHVLDDIAPTRLQAAESAAASFIEQPGLGHPDRDRRVQRLRRGRPAADQRQGRAPGRAAQPHDRTPDGDRQRDPGRHRRDRRGRPVASRPSTGDGRPGVEPPPGRERRVRAGHHRRC